MNIQLDPELYKKLREKINENQNFTYEKKADFKFPNSKKKVTSQAFNCICATVNRIGDLVEHCNGINIDCQFGLCDFFNYTQSLIECIKVLGEIYDVPPMYKGNNANDISIFNKPGNDQEGNDEKYFTYLRSLCSIHPVETSRHKVYQGEEAEWCPYISNGKSPVFNILSINHPEFKNADFVATVYRNDMELSKWIPIKVNELISYVERRYQHIQVIINAIEKYNNDLICSYINTEIRNPDQFNNYISYLENLQKVIIERCGKTNNYQTKEWIAVLKAHFNDHEMQRKLILYQEALKQGITIIHDQLQKMNVDYYSDFEPITYNKRFIPNSYAVDKLSYLYKDFQSMTDSEAFALAESGGEEYTSPHIDEMLDHISNAQQRCFSMDDIKELAVEMQSFYNITDSEWARIQLKIIEPYFEHIVEFDYHLNDWYLYLQVQVAFYLISQRS